MNEGRYNLRKTLPTLKVDKALLTRLENYLVKSIPEILHIPSDEVASVFIINFNEELPESFDKLSSGRYIVNSIENISSDKFADEIKKITIGFSFNGLANIEQRRVRIMISFSPEKLYSKLQIQITGKNSQELGYAIYLKLMKLLSENKNLNYFFYDPPYFRLIIIALGALGIFYSSDIKIFLVFYGILTILVIFYLFNYYFLRYYKPYCSFDTNRQERRDKVVNFILLGFLGFVLFGTIAFSIRKHFLDF